MIFPHLLAQPQAHCRLLGSTATSTEVAARRQERPGLSTVALDPRGHNRVYNKHYTRLLRLVNEKFFKIKNGEYWDGIKSIGNKIGMVCDAYLTVLFVHNTTAPVTQATSALHNMIEAPRGGNIRLVFYRSNSVVHKQN